MNATVGRALAAVRSDRYTVDAAPAPHAVVVCGHQKQHTPQREHTAAAPQARSPSCAAAHTNCLEQTDRVKCVLSLRREKGDVQAVGASEERPGDCVRGPSPPGRPLPRADVRHAQRKLAAGGVCGGVGGLGDRAGGGLVFRAGGDIGLDGIAVSPGTDAAK